ncbi:hypothetical protein KC357_g6843 [Hortaea werneckii]|nr:hypothetical protein KC357_g6843 [Hortaea werneckii]
MHLLHAGVWLAWCLPGVIASNNATRCKCLPGDQCWPTTDDWNQLNSTLNGHLIRSKPPASVCYPDQPDYDHTACQEVLGHWKSSAWHAQNSVSVDAPPEDGCPPIYSNGTSTAGDPDAGARGCNFGAYPAYVINVTSPQDVQTGITFAKEHNIRLNVKGTGHGESTASGSLSIWTANLKDMEFSRNWTGCGCSSDVEGRMAITFGAGVQDREAFEFAAKSDVVVVGGTDSTVGIVGWATGGGHGYLTGTYGVGADNILEATVVTGTGDILVANQCQHAELLWALRGGGHGFGVVTSLTMKAYPMPSTTMWTLDITANDHTNDSSYWDVIAGVHSELPRLFDAGLQGYYTISGPPLSFGYAAFAYDTNSSMVESDIRSLVSWLETKTRTANISSAVSDVGPWIDLFHMFNLTESAGGGLPTRRTSRLLPVQSLTDNKDFLARTLQAVGPRGDYTDGPVSNFDISGTVTCGSKSSHLSSLNPSWDDAVVHLISSVSWDWTVPNSDAENLAWDVTNRKGAALRSLAPDSGAYFNEHDPNEPDWQYTLFGDNYPRLQGLKRRFDPDGMQYCHHCVGSDEWTLGKDGRLCRQPWA